MENMMVTVLVLAMLSLASHVQSDDATSPSTSSTDSTKQAADKSKDIQQSMYAILRTMALPDATTKKGTPVTQRFVLQVPGKLLNPMDYDPTDYKADVTTNRLSSFIPPVIEENMFRLTDIVPVANPMKGGETGESFVDMYEATLNQLDVRGFQKKTAERRERYKNAINYLAQSTPDPDDMEKNTTRLGMYIRLQKKYNDIRLDMEDKIKEAKDRHEDDLVEYQTWFQTHYPAMYANVENAYTEWLVFGEKDLVELYKAHLDVESQGVAVEEARMALRSSGKISLDRSSTIYPVHFEPSNWYQYLKAKPQTLSREQLEIKLGDIVARLTILESMKGKTTSKEVTDYITKLEKERDDTKRTLDTKTTELNDKKLACMQALNKDDQTCKDYRAAQSEIATLSTTYAKQKAAAEYAGFQLRASDESKESIDRLMTSLEAQKKRYTTLLENLQTNQITDVPKGSSENDTQDFQAGWMQFEFDSSTSSKSVDTSSKEYAASMSFNAGGLGWGVSGGAGYSRAQQDFAQNLSQADIKISAKILKVTIKRPWFKSSVFKFNDIVTHSDQRVSPGPMPEPDLIRSLQDLKTYLLPQFVNAFLLAKDVKMEFQGVDSSVASHAVQESANAQLSGNYGPFSASSSFSYGSSESQMKVQSTADGLRISIPGAQVIGYYVTVLPCFPSNTCQ